MNAKQINKLHSSICECETEVDKLEVLIDACEELILEKEAKLDSTWKTWDQRVVALGKAFEQAKTQHGEGWERDFDSRGYLVSYTTACRYIACLKHPEAATGLTNIVDWANRSVELDRKVEERKARQKAKRKQKAEDRKSKSDQATDRIEPAEPIEDQQQNVTAPQSGQSDVNANA